MYIAKKVRAVCALLLTFALVCTSPVLAETLRVVKRGSASSLNIPMNRAVVVESDTPFAELSIANPSIADFSTLSDRTIYVLGKAPGLTTLTLLDASGRLISNVDVRVSADISEFKERLRQILPNEKIEVRTANDGIVLSGTATSVVSLGQAMELAERYAPGRVSNLMSVGGVQQVMLKVRFAEMQRSVAKSLGSSLALGGNVLGGNVGLKMGSGTAVGTAAQANLLGGNSPAASTAQGATLLGFNAGPVEVGILLEALETKGFVRTLAEPNLTALSGKEAQFLAGGQYPIPTVQDGSVAVEFKDFGVGLSFTPTVLNNNVINVELTASVSSIDTTNSIVANGILVNGFKTRSTSTTVEMRDGESFAIAGLLQDDFRDSAGQVPWLGDVPILGALFRSADYSRSQSELVIIVTPHLVTPTKGQTLALPTDRIRAPSEKDLFLNGKILKKFETTNKAAGEIARQDFNSSYGYVLD